MSTCNNSENNIQVTHTRETDAMTEVRSGNYANTDKTGTGLTTTATAGAFADTFLAFPFSTFSTVPNLASLSFFFSCSAMERAAGATVTPKRSDRLLKV